MKKYLITTILLCFILANHALGGEMEDYVGYVYYIQGAYLEAASDLGHAYSYYKYAEKYLPGNTRLKKDLAKILMEIGDLEKARKYALQLIDIPAASSEGHMIMAEIEYKRKEFEKALQHLLKLEGKTGVSRARVLKFLSRVYLELDRTGQARESLEEAREISPGDFFINYKLGFIYMNQGKVDKAIESFRDATEIDPDFTGAHIALGSTLMEAGRAEEALEAVKDALEIEPSSDLAIKELLRIVYSGSYYDTGINILEPLYQKGRLEKRGKLELGKMYLRENRLESALNLFRDLLEEVGGNPSIMRAVSEIEMRLGNFSNVVEYQERLIELQPDNFDNYVGLILVAFGLAGEPSGDDQQLEITEEKKEHYLAEAASRVPEDSADDNYIIGSVYNKLERYDKAEKFLRRAEKIEPGSRKILLELAAVYESMEDYGSALKRLKSLHRKFPEDASINNFYGYLLAQKGDSLSVAEELVRLALDKEPQNGYFMDSLGWIRFRQGDYREALEIFNKAVELAGDDPVIWEHLGHTYRELGKVEEAGAAYRKSLKIDPDNDRVQEELKNLDSSM